jgi:hypothetical protein
LGIAATKLQLIGEAKKKWSTGNALGYLATGAVLPVFIPAITSCLSFLAKRTAALQRCKHPSDLKHVAGSFGPVIVFFFATSSRRLVGFPPFPIHT